jgi:hypothetical protein
MCKKAHFWHPYWTKLVHEQVTGQTLKSFICCAFFILSRAACLIDWSPSLLNFALACASHIGVLEKMYSLISLNLRDKKLIPVLDELYSSLDQEEIEKTQLL